MAIIGSEVEKSLDVLKSEARSQIQALMNVSFDRLVRDFGTLFQQVWNNQNGLTPQQIFDAFGTDAVQLFVIAGTIQDAVNHIQPSTLNGTPPLPYVIHQDGTVTVG